MNACCDLEIAGISSKRAQRRTIRSGDASDLFGAGSGQRSDFREVDNKNEHHQFTYWEVKA